MPNLTQLSNGELATEMYTVTKRYGELSLWIVEADIKVRSMITERVGTTGDIKYQIELKHGAEVELYTVLSDLKKIELEMDRRVQGKEVNGNT